MAERLAEVLRDLNVRSFVSRAREASLISSIAEWDTAESTQNEPHRLARTGIIYERQGLGAFQRWIGSQEEQDRVDSREAFEAAFDCWEALREHVSNARSTSALDQLLEGLRNPQVPANLDLAFHYAVCGTLADRAAETRLGLEEIEVPEPPEPWDALVFHHVLRALVLLTRKAGGWADIDDALASVEELRRLQAEYETDYLDRTGDDASQALAAIHLVGLYHLAQLMTITGEYMRDGQPAITQVRSRIDSQRDRSRDALDMAGLGITRHSTDLLWATCRTLANNTIWAHASGLGPKVQELAAHLAGRDRLRPVIELWPSQQAALADRLLDTYPRALLVEMPTSAGKTLLAKFVLVQSKALNPDGLVAYVVPTRALVNQVTIDLRNDLGPLGLMVEQAIPAYELDPTEASLLRGRIDILVTTPEKLDLLIRSNHPVAENIGLVIADEAHNLREPNRGARLELLLGTIKRDKPEARFLLLSPFLPNGEELVRWLGDARHHAIAVTWTPSNRVVGTTRVRGRGSQRAVYFETLPAADNSDIEGEIAIPMARAFREEGGTKEKVTRLTVKSLLEEGSILILCRGAGTSIKRAESLRNELPQVDTSPALEAVIAYLTAETGREPLLADCLKHGVAYHHAGLSPEARWLVERLISDDVVRVVCGTTTLAQGMNFPIKTVIVETLRKGDAALGFQDFWNIAGRAGRAMVDSIGLVAFPARNDEDVVAYRRFLSSEAEEISSQLATLISNAGDLVENFDLSAVRRRPELSVLLQFLAHAMRVSGSDAVAADVEDLLRASLVFHQARRQGEEVARRLVDLCRSYVEQTRRRDNIAGVLTLADQTGFATPSVLQLLATVGPSLRNAEGWRPERLFGGNLEPLVERIRLVASLPEISLGQGDSEPFNPHLVAAILRDWVQGKTLTELATEYRIGTDGVDGSPPDDQAVAEFSKYLFSQLIGKASWGLGALESVCLAGQEEDVMDEARYVPSMVYFGVREREAIWLRSAGVPRLVADPLALLWRSRSAGEPESYDQIRGWVSSLSDSEWERAIPRGTGLTPQHMRILWQSFNGQMTAANSGTT